MKAKSFEMLLAESLMSIFLELPLTIVQGANLTGFQPSGDAMEMKGVVANSPSNRALLTRCGGLICLALDAEVHDVIPADGAVVNDDVPGPEGDGVPFLHLESLLASLVGDGGGGISGGRSGTFIVDLHLDANKDCSWSK